MQAFIASLRITLVTIVIGGVGYTAVILGCAKLFAADSAAGSLVAIDGKLVGSRQVAQEFTRPGYFWSRPSAVDFDGAGAGGSNKSPTSTDLTDRASGIVRHYGATVERPLPSELAAASGSGLDPHISEHAALYQEARIAKARSISRAQVEALVKQQAFAPGGTFMSDRLVNVLELNLALDAELAAK
jgi:potassium-transporting ATPase KdpC subunit